MIGQAFINIKIANGKHNFKTCFHFLNLIWCGGTFKVTKTLSRREYENTGDGYARPRFLNVQCIWCLPFRLLYLNSKQRGLFYCLSTLSSPPPYSPPLPFPLPLTSEQIQVFFFSSISPHPFARRSGTELYDLGGGGGGFRIQIRNN